MNFLSTTFDLLLVILGFGFIVFIHELGHFVAARWAGIRVLAFAIGFGPALVSYRKGLGFRKGSSESEYLDTLKREGELATKRAAGDRPNSTSPLTHSISPTEYRLNALPFGGYVKMLGQDDVDATSRSDAPDSYQSCVPWKRMVVISAGVIMNVILAAALFVVVFMVGREVDPPVIGGVEPGRPAALATPQAAWSQVGIGLQAGDIIERIGDETPRTFDDMAIAAAMAEKNVPLLMQVRRTGHAEPIMFEVTPKKNSLTGMQDMGVVPSLSATVDSDFGNLRKGMVLTHVGGKQVSSVHELGRVVRDSGGSPVIATFKDEKGVSIDQSVTPQPELQVAFISGESAGKQVVREQSHVLGLSGVMSVATEETAVPEKVRQLGLQPGDIFARLGNLEFPSLSDGRAQVAANAGKQVRAIVLRKKIVSPQSEAGTTEDGVVFMQVDLGSLPVNRKGQIGIGVTETAADLTLLSAPIMKWQDSAGNSHTSSTPAISPGSIIRAVNGVEVANLRDIQRVLRKAVLENTSAEPPTVTLSVVPAVSGAPQLPGLAVPDATSVEMSWKLTKTDADELRELSWLSDLRVAFKPAKTTLQATGPIDALKIGLAETKRMMLMTYLTFVRLVQGTVKVEHLKGPVGIAHIGTLFAERGFIWLLFFMAMISVNLAVINFLPLPIVDGGQFLFILYEWIRGKPVPVGFQNAVTIAGLVLIGGMFLFVTYNDIRNLIGI
ncbi:MAG: site-2 protease family protein [Phycisphaerales bacterium]